jgi:hypothetical protein
LHLDRAVQSDPLEYFHSFEDLMISPSAMDPSPDWAIVKRLKEYDPEIEVHWERGFNRWFLSAPDRTGRRVRVLTIMESNGQYRPLDERTLVVLRLADSFKNDDIHNFAKVLKDNDRAVNAQQEHDLKQAFLDRNEDLYRAYFGSEMIRPAGGWKEFD